jgi:hypothetical protein
LPRINGDHNADDRANHGINGPPGRDELEKPPAVKMTIWLAFGGINSDRFSPITSGDLAPFACRGKEASGRNLTGQNRGKPAKNRGFLFSVVAAMVYLVGWGVRVFIRRDLNVAED